MRYIAPPTQAQQAWNLLVRKGIEMPGLEGSYWRLLQRVNVEEVSRWCLGERVRGVPIQTLMDAMEAFVSSCVIQVAGQTGRKQVMPCAAEILRHVANIVHMDVQQVVDNKKSIEMLMRQASRH